MLSLDNYTSDEAYRRLKLLGETIALASYRYKEICDRAQKVGLPVKILAEWWRSFHAKGLEGIRPSWQPLEEKSLMVVLDRRAKLGDQADEDTLTPDYYEKVSEATGWSWSQTKRWVHRYRTGGLWGLAPENSPKNKSKKQLLSPRDIGSFDEKVLEQIYKRFEVIEPLLKGSITSQAAVESRAKEVDLSPRTIWNYLMAYRAYGLAGLAPIERSDKGKLHNVSEKMLDVIIGIRLSHLDFPVRAVYEQACSRARALGEVEPTLSQVRSVLNNIPKPVKLIADGRQNAFRNSYRFTHRIDFEKIGTVYQIDNAVVNVLER